MLGPVEMVAPIGERHEMLEVIRVQGMHGRKVQVRCDCGAEREMYSNHFRRYKSCGCTKLKFISKSLKRRSDGYKAARSSWSAMISRCTDKTNQSYPRYGGIGIRVCEHWMIFENFLADMGERPTGHTLDRINSAGIYEQSNCRWATPTEQTNNMKNNVMLTFKGETKTLPDWARTFGLPREAVRSRIKVMGWSVEDALLTPIDVSKRRKS